MVMGTCRSFGRNVMRYRCESPNIADVSCLLSRLWPNSFQSALLDSFSCVLRPSDARSLGQEDDPKPLSHLGSFHTLNLTGQTCPSFESIGRSPHQPNPGPAPHSQWSRCLLTRRTFGFCQALHNMSQLHGHQFFIQCLSI